MYDMSPAQHWGNGAARDFYVQIDASDLAVTNDYYDNIYNIDIKGLPFERKGNIYSYKTSNFKFKDSKPIEMEYKLINGLDLDEIMNKRIPNSAYTITATSQQSAYPVSNLSDMDFGTAWVASKDGIGDKITITFKEPTKVHCFYFVGGYYKSRSTYEQNNRVRTVKMSYEYYEGKEKYEGQRTCTIDMDDYEPLFFDNLWIHKGVLKEMISTDYQNFRTTKIEFEIIDINKGTKYDDTCISEIILFSPPKASNYIPD